MTLNNIIMTVGKLVSRECKLMSIYLHNHTKNYYSTCKVSHHTGQYKLLNNHVCVLQTVKWFYWITMEPFLRGQSDKRPPPDLSSFYQS